MKWTQVLFGLCCLCFWGILTWSRFAGQHGDSWGSLLSAQAWLEHGSPELSAYQDKVDLYASQFYRTERGVYYFFPPFSAFLSVPFVALARLAGWQMWDAQAEGLLQRQICVLALCSLLAMLAYGYRCLMNDRTALAVAFATICGGSLLGSLGGALNSQVPAIIFMTWAQVLFLRERYGTGDWKGWQIGCLLAFSYLCRPTGAIWALAALAYVSWRKPRQLPASLLSLALVVGLYSLACWHFFDTPIHRYY
ncbi:MAG: hypothetical protein U0931_39645, partial [Vulcanimicrobiota bacterium]